MAAELNDAWQLVLSDGINELIARASREKGRRRQQLLREAQNDSEIINWLNVGWCEVADRRTVASRSR